jgi:hypothetical protein
MHASDVVLQAFRSALEAIPGLEDHVVVDEEKIAEVEDLPWCWISLGDEDVNGETLNGKKTRGVFINADVLVAARYAAIQASNDIAAKIEDRIDADRTLGSLVGNAALQNIVRSRNDDASVARVRLTFLVTYWTRAGAAETPV